MPHLPWYVWAVATLGSYVVISFALDLACRRLFAGRKIAGEGRVPAKLVTWKLVALFLINTFQISAALALADGFHEQGRGGLYEHDISSPAHLVLIAAQLLFILAVFDANFYWVHRLAHRHKRILKRFHAEHHRPRFPNVWHLHYQHPVDYFATTVAPLAWIALLLIPLSTQSYLLAVIIAAFLNIAGHSGYEVSNTFIGFPTPNGWAAYLDPRRRWLARWFNNVVHHDLHHQKFSCNYSLYFTFWDRLCGTCHPDTDRVDEYVGARARD